MSLWMVRAGKYGEQEQGALDNGVVTIGWNRFSDLSNVKTKEEFSELYAKVYPEDVANKRKFTTQVGQVWRFIHEIKKGDIVTLPLKTQSAIAIGKVEGEYQYKQLADNIKHIIKVKWLKTIPRSEFDQDLLYSFGALSTVCQISRNNAENRVEELLKKEEFLQDIDIEPEDVEETIDIEEFAGGQIIKFIRRKFKGHNLARLVEAILQAQGYVTQKSSPGPDGGIDILAAAGPLGFTTPRICVQVKSSSSQINVKVLRELQGVMTKVRADQGLLISLGGFTNSARREARDTFFSMRLWDAGNLIKEIFKHYNKFDDELKAELPLKRIWSLVLEED